MKRVRKGDTVIILTGKDKGKVGTVLGIMEGDRVIVEGINVVRKHQKPQPARGIAGGIEERSLPIHISNVALFNPSLKRGGRVGFRILADGRKVRYFKATNELLDV